MLDQPTLQTLKVRLTSEHDRLSKELSNISHITSEGKREADFVNLGIDEEEAGLEVQEFELNVDLKKKLERDLGLIERALARIDDGTYGVCVRCKHEIPLERLSVLPEAEYCNNCSMSLSDDAG